MIKRYTIILFLLSPIQSFASGTYIAPPPRRPVVLEGIDCMKEENKMKDACIQRAKEKKKPIEIKRDK
jgi:hypothetical protein